MNCTRQARYKVIMELIEEYAKLHRLKAEAENDAYTYEWQRLVKEDVRDLSKVKRKLEQAIKDLL